MGPSAWRTTVMLSGKALFSFESFLGTSGLPFFAVGKAFLAAGLSHVSEVRGDL